MNDEHRLGWWLLQARTFARRSQRDAARALGISAPTLSRWEAGERRVAVSYLTRLADLYELPAAFFLSPPETAHERLARERETAKQAGQP